MQRRDSFFRAFSTALAVVFLSTNCLFAHVTELSFWAERNKNILIERRGPPEQILQHLPNIQPFARTARLAQREIHPSRSAVRTVIHIQDVHKNLEAQKNIAATLQTLIDQGQIDLIALEGAFAPIDLTAFRLFPDQAAVRRVADHLLQENKISGAMQAAFTSPKKLPPLIGVDDRGHYDANVLAYRASALLVQTNKAILVSLEKDLAGRKSAAFGPKLRAFDAAVERYRNGATPMGIYVEDLAARGRAAGSTMKTFVDALTLEHALDFARVETERARLLSRLMSKLTPAETATLVDASLAFQSGRIGHQDFYAFLQAACASHRMPLTEFPSMEKYLAYVRLSEGIDAENLFIEVQNAENAEYARLATTEREKELTAESKRLFLVGKILDFALTKDEWEEYKNYKSRIAKFKIQMNVQSFEAFYEQAEARDHAMAANLLAAMAERNAKTAVLITGGFHTTGIDREIRASNCSTMSVVPKITKIDGKNGTAYLSAFTREKTPLDKLFDGEKLFLSELQMTPEINGEAAIDTAAEALTHGTHPPSPTEAAHWIGGALRWTGVQVLFLTGGAVQFSGRRLLSDGTRDAVEVVRAPDWTLRMRETRMLPKTLARLGAGILAEQFFLRMILVRGLDLTPGMTMALFVAAHVALLAWLMSPRVSLPTFLVGAGLQAAAGWAIAGAWRQAAPFAEIFLMQFAYDAAILFAMRIMPGFPAAFLSLDSMVKTAAEPEPGRRKIALSDGPFGELFIDRIGHAVRLLEGRLLARWRLDKKQKSIQLPVGNGTVEFFVQKIASGHPSWFFYDSPEAREAFESDPALQVISVGRFRFLDNRETLVAVHDLPEFLRDYDLTDVMQRLFGELGIPDPQLGPLPFRDLEKIVKGIRYVLALDGNLIPTWAIFRADADAWVDAMRPQRKADNVGSEFNRHLHLRLTQGDFISAFSNNAPDTIERAIAALRASLERAGPNYLLTLRFPKRNVRFFPLVLGPNVPEMGCDLTLENLKAIAGEYGLTISLKRAAPQTLMEPVNPAVHLVVSPERIFNLFSGSHVLDLLADLSRRERLGVAPSGWSVRQIEIEPGLEVAFVTRYVAENKIVWTCDLTDSILRALCRRYQVAIRRPSQGSAARFQGPPILTSQLELGEFLPSVAGIIRELNRELIRLRQSKPYFKVRWGGKEVRILYFDARPSGRFILENTPATLKALEARFGSVEARAFLFDPPTDGEDYLSIYGPLSDLSLSVRALAFMNREYPNVRCVLQVLMTRENLFHVQAKDEPFLREIRQRLEHYKLRIGMTPKEINAWADSQRRAPWDMRFEMPIQELDISLKMKTFLLNRGIALVGQLFTSRIRDLAGIRLNEIRRAADKKGLTLPFEVTDNQLREWIKTPPEALTRPKTRGWARFFGLNPYGKFTEEVFAPFWESLIHFRQDFLKDHGFWTEKQEFEGVPRIFRYAFVGGFAGLAAPLFFFFALAFEWGDPSIVAVVSALAIPLLTAIGYWAGGVLGHRSYNREARRKRWRVLTTGDEPTRPWNDMRWFWALDRDQKAIVIDRMTKLKAVRPTSTEELGKVLNDTDAWEAPLRHPVKAIVDASMNSAEAALRLLALAEFLVAVKDVPALDEHWNGDLAIFSRVFVNAWVFGRHRGALTLLPFSSANPSGSRTPSWEWRLTVGAMRAVRHRRTTATDAVQSTADELEELPYDELANDWVLPPGFSLPNKPIDFPVSDDAMDGFFLAAYREQFSTPSKAVGLETHDVTNNAFQARTNHPEFKNYDDAEEEAIFKDIKFSVVLTPINGGSRTEIKIWNKGEINLVELQGQLSRTFNVLKRIQQAARKAAENPKDFQDLLTKTGQRYFLDARYHAAVMELLRLSIAELKKVKNSASLPMKTALRLIAMPFVSGKPDSIESAYLNVPPRDGAPPQGYFHNAGVGLALLRLVLAKMGYEFKSSSENGETSFTVVIPPGVVRAVPLTPFPKETPSDSNDNRGRGSNAVRRPPLLWLAFPFLLLALSGCASSANGQAPVLFYAAILVAVAFGLNLAQRAVGIAGQGVNTEPPRKAGPLTMSVRNSKRSIKLKLYTIVIRGNIANPLVYDELYEVLRLAGFFQFDDADEFRNRKHTVLRGSRVIDPYIKRKKNAPSKKEQNQSHPLKDGDILNLSDDSRLAPQTPRTKSDSTSIVDSRNQNVAPVVRLSYGGHVKLATVDEAELEEILLTGGSTIVRSRLEGPEKASASLFVTGQPPLWDMTGDKAEKEPAKEPALNALQFIDLTRHYKSVSARLTALRSLMSFTRTQMARSLDVTYGEIQRMEDSAYSPGIAIRWRMLLRLYKFNRIAPDALAAFFELSNPLDTKELISAVSIKETLREMRSVYAVTVTRLSAVLGIDAASYASLEDPAKLTAPTIGQRRRLALLYFIERLVPFHEARQIFQVPTQDDVLLSLKNKSLGQILRALQDYADYDQKDISDKTPIPRLTYGRWLRDERLPLSFKKLAPLIDLFVVHHGFPPNELRDLLFRAYEDVLGPEPKKPVDAAAIFSAIEGRPFFEAVEILRIQMEMMVKEITTAAGVIFNTYKKWRTGRGLPRQRPFNKLIRALAVRGLDAALLRKALQQSIKIQKGGNAPVNSIFYYAALLAGFNEPAARRIGRAGLWGEAAAFIVGPVALWLGVTPSAFGIAMLWLTVSFLVAAFLIQPFAQLHVAARVILAKRRSTQGKPAVLDDHLAEFSLYYHYVLSLAAVSVLSFAVSAADIISPSVLALASGALMAIVGVPLAFRAVRNHRRFDETLWKDPNGGPPPGDVERTLETTSLDLHIGESLGDFRKNPLDRASVRDKEDFVLVADDVIAAKLASKTQGGKSFMEELAQARAQNHAGRTLVVPASESAASVLARASIRADGVSVIAEGPNLFSENSIHTGRFVRMLESRGISVRERASLLLIIPDGIRFVLDAGDDASLAKTLLDQALLWLIKGEDIYRAHIEWPEKALALMKTAA